MAWQLFSEKATLDFTGRHGIMFMIIAPAIISYEMRLCDIQQHLFLKLDGFKRCRVSNSEHKPYPNRSKEDEVLAGPVLLSHRATCLIR